MITEETIIKFLLLFELLALKYLGPLHMNYLFPQFLTLAFFKPEEFLLLQELALVTLV